MDKMRIEKDSLGERRVPADAYYGAETDRAVENFPISGLRADTRFVDAYLVIKKAAAIANQKTGRLSEDRAVAICRAADEILGGALRDQFVVDVFQMGAGTAFHMNVNEVLANLSNEILGGKKGGYAPIHPNDHVNLGQSTNDTFPTAMRLAALFLLRERLYGPLEKLERVLGDKAKEFDGVLKSARTHLQDAVPIRLGQEFAAYAAAVKKCRLALIAREEALCELGIGGSAAGTGLNTTVSFVQSMVAELCRLTALPLKSAPDLREAMQSQRPIAEISSGLRNLALEIIRISNDLRLLSSGPYTGLAEINLPAQAPGSSIMPGKVNPSMLEMAAMVAFQVIGCDTVIAHAVMAGQLELNVMMPVMAFNLNFAVTILGNAINALSDKCIAGITANPERCRYFAERSSGLSTALTLSMGYARAAEITKEAIAAKKSIVEIIRQKKILSEDQIRQLLDPFKMTDPGA